MRILKALTVSLIVACSSVSAEQWISPVELEFKNSEPDLYQEYLQAKTLLDEYNGQPEHMEQAFQLLIGLQKKDGTHAPVLREIGRLYIMASYYVGEDKFDPRTTDVAEDAILRSISLAPNYEDAYVLLGHLYTNVERYDHAIAALDKAEELGSKSPWLKNNLADVYIFTGRLNEAKWIAQTVVDSDTTIQKAKDHADRLLTRIIQLQPEQPRQTAEAED